MGRRRAFGILPALIATGILLWLAAAGVVRASDAIARLVDALGNARSYKVRIQAAALLSRLDDPQAIQALARAAVSDRHPTVRTIVVQLLGHDPQGNRIRGQQARLALGRALADPDPSVRRQAARSLAELERALSPPGASRTREPAPAARGDLLVAVGHMGDRTGRAPRAFRDRMREEIRGLLGREPRLTLAEVDARGVAFLVDGTISRFELATGGSDVEAICAIELVVSRPPRGIVTVASGEAIVGKPKAQYRATMADKLQEEALTHAVRSAHENLSRFLATQ